MVIYKVSAGFRIALPSQRHSKPRFAGQLSFYFSAVDAQVKSEQDVPSVGLLLCKKRNKRVVEYALRDINKPIGDAEYQLAPALPANLEKQLPSIERIELELEKDVRPLLI